MKTKIPSFLLLFALLLSPAFADAPHPQERPLCKRLPGRGFLELQNGQCILHLQGTPYERGEQHGSLLKEQIQRNIATYIDQGNSPIPGRIEEFTKNIPLLMSFVPEDFLWEMEGLSQGSGVPLEKIIALNLFPEMFHCSGITVSGQASKDGALYHARVLDYAIGKNLQTTAVLQVVEPNGKIPFLNVSYAGFIGTITGMNLEKISIGEIGGLGYGSWNGMPMAFLLREILENASSIEEVKAILQNTPRTCEYYYVFSDGKTNESIGVYATANQLQYIAPGASHALMAPSSDAPHSDHDKCVLTDCTLETTPFQTLLFGEDRRQALLFRLQPADCLLLTGFPHPERYPVLVERILAGYGNIDEQALIDIIRRPVAMDSNLHNAIFKPSELKVWISHAGPNNEPACDQEYTGWDLPGLLKR